MYRSINSHSYKNTISIINNKSIIIYVFSFREYPSMKKISSRTTTYLLERFGPGTSGLLACRPQGIAMSSATDILRSQTIALEGGVLRCEGQKKKC